jgi:hypothetical protein
VVEILRTGQVLNKKRNGDLLLVRESFEPSVKRPRNFWAP